MRGARVSLIWLVGARQRRCPKEAYGCDLWGRYDTIPREFVSVGIAIPRYADLLTRTGRGPVGMRQRVERWLESAKDLNARLEALNRYSLRRPTQTRDGFGGPGPCC